MTTLYICLSVWASLSFAFYLILSFSFDEFYYACWWNNGSPFMSNLNIFGHIFFHLLFLPPLIVFYLIALIGFLCTYKGGAK